MGCSEATVVTELCELSGLTGPGLAWTTRSHLSTEIVDRLPDQLFRGQGIPLRCGKLAPHGVNLDQWGGETRRNKADTLCLLLLLRSAEWQCLLENLLESPIY